VTFTTNQKEMIVTQRTAGKMRRLKSLRLKVMRNTRIHYYLTPLLRRISQVMIIASLDARNTNVSI
jgi:hypothetical protein